MKAMILVRVLAEPPPVPPLEELGERDDAPQGLLQVVAGHVREPLQLLVRAAEACRVLRELELGLFPPGDIDVHAEDADDLSLLVADPAPGRGDPADLARRADDPVLEVERFAAGERRLALALGPRNVVRMHALPPLAIGESPALLEPVEPEELGRGGIESCPDVPVPDRDVRALLREPQPFLALAERLFRPLLLGDVLVDDEERVPAERQEGAGPPLRAVRAGDLDLARDRRAGLDRLPALSDERLHHGHGVPELAPCPADQGLPGLSELGGEPRVRPGEPFVPIPERDPVREGTEDRIEEPAVLPEAIRMRPETLGPDFGFVMESSLFGARRLEGRDVLPDDERADVSRRRP